MYISADTVQAWDQRGMPSCDQNHAEHVSYEFVQHSMEQHSIAQADMEQHSTSQHSTPHLQFEMLIVPVQSICQVLEQHRIIMGIA